MATYFVVACDGGGVRGYITASVLQQLTNDLDQYFLDQAFLTAGTSTGSFIALALAKGISINTIQQTYRQSSAQQVFTPNPNIGGGSLAAARARAALEKARAGSSIGTSWWEKILQEFEYLINAQYTNTGVKAVAQNLLGASTTLDDLSGRVLVNTLQLDNGLSPPTWTPITLSNLSDSASASMYAYEAALCSGAAPIYFPPYSPTSLSLGYCADGGLFANNPSMSAIAALADPSGSDIPLNDIYLLSVGTGVTPDAMSSTIINDWGGPLSMGPLEWLWPEPQSDGNATAPRFAMLSAMMDSASAAITLNAQALLGSNCCRVDVPLSSPVALDDTSTAAYQVMDSSLQSYYASSAYTSVKNWIQSQILSQRLSLTGARFSVG